MTLVGVALARGPEDAIAGGGEPQATEDHVTFHLAITDGARFLETRALEKSLQVGDSEAEVTKMTQKSEIVFRKRGGGFSVSVKPRLANPTEPLGTGAEGLAAALAGLKLRYEFDAQGNLVKLHGLAEALEEIGSLMPAELRSVVDTLAPPVVSELKDEWVSRYTGLNGQTFRVGYKQSGQTPLTLKEGLPPVSATVARGVARRSRCGGRECVELWLGYRVEDAGGYGEAISQMLRGWMSQVVQLGEVPSSERRQILAALPRMKVRGLQATVERQVDPSTMMVYEEKRTKSYLATLGDGDQVKWSEQTTFTYQSLN